MVTIKAESQLLGEKVVFLDTNALTCLHLYWEICNKHNVKLVAPSSIDTLFPTLRGKLGERSRESLKNGQKVLRYLQQQLQNRQQQLQKLGIDPRDIDPFVYSSRFCWMEFRHVLIDIKVDERLTQAGVPFRMRRHSSFDRYDRIMTEDDYKDIEDQKYRFVSELKNNMGIDIVDVEEDANKFTQVLCLAQFIIGKVAIEVLDAFVFASAITGMASELISFDRSFRTIVNNGSLRRLLMQDVQTVLGALPAGFQLPNALKP